MTTKFYALQHIDNSNLEFAVVYARYKDNWIFVRNKSRETWEMPGGHKEKDETIEDTAKRELYEETGATKSIIEPIGIYSVTSDQHTTYGQLFYAEVLEQGELPESEIAETVLSKTLPPSLTYPDIQPILHKKIISHLLANYPMKIHLLGPSGSGTTTLGKIISEKYDILHIDSDDVFWMPTDPPFSVKRKSEARSDLLKSITRQNDSWVLSGSCMGWGDFIKEELDLVIYKYLEPEERIRRLKKREKERFGKRIEPGNDMYENHRNFIQWAAAYETGGMEMRSIKSEESWMENLKCDTVRIDKEMSIAEEMRIVDQSIEKTSTLR